MDAKTTVDIVLKNAEGQDVTYYGVSEVKLRTADGGSQVFSIGGNQETPDQSKCNCVIATTFKLISDWDSVLIDPYVVATPFPLISNWQGFVVSPSIYLGTFEVIE